MANIFGGRGYTEMQFLLDEAKMGAVLALSSATPWVGLGPGPAL
jgi:hypothetical protein